MNPVLGSIAERSGSVVRGDKRYIDYGCYCTPTEAHRSDGNWFGTGEPVDEIDKLCRGLFFGYQCLKKDHKECDSTRAYEWTLEDSGAPKCGKIL